MAQRRLGFWRRLVVLLVKPPLTVMTRRTWTGMHHVPTRGPVILVANHLSHTDPLICAHYVYDAGRWPRFLAKAAVFRIPVAGWLLRQVRQIPVERGSADAVRSLDDAVQALQRGAAVVIYPEGTITGEPGLWPMRGKTGAARLALATGAPVIPLAMWGPQLIFDPRTRKLRPRPRTPVAVAAGPPVPLDRWVGAVPTRAILEEMSDTIMLAIRDLLSELRDGPPPPLFQPAPADRALRGGEAR
ncbi:MAG TPA: lysophospholipid acyltransferase family protein [Catenuloplanes sp.]